MAIVRRSLTAAGLLATAAVAVQQTHDAIATAAKGLDLRPIDHAVVALLHAGSVYSDPRFVYPPSAAVAFLPMALLRYAAAVNVWLAVCAVGVVAAGLLCMAPWRRGFWPLASVLAALVLVKSDVLRDTLWIGNVSLLLAPAAVGILFLFEAERWRAGVALLVLTLLLKPLLMPLILIPLLRRRWRAVIEPMLAGAVALGLAIAFVPGGTHFFSVLRYLGGAGSLTGRAAVYNISIEGLAARLALGGWGIVARVAVGLSAAAVVWLWTRRPERAGGTAAVGTLLLLAVILVGSLSEDHYLLVAAPCLLTALARSGRPWALIVALPGLALVAFPRAYVGQLAGSPQGLQVRYLLAELLLAVAAAAVVWMTTNRATVR